jgi:excinuclease ABC subunit A
VLQRLTDGGNTVVVIEHNLDVIKTADWVIDLGPEGGDGGGKVMVTGTPEQVALHPASYTGRFLRRVLKPDALAAAPAAGEPPGNGANGKRRSRRSRRPPPAGRGAAPGGGAGRRAPAGGGRPARP